jgi:hypothetical protein
VSVTVPWEPYREPLRATLTRTITIALVVGFVVSRFSGGIKLWPFLTVLFLWPSFGGHWVELFFLNWLRPRLPAGRVEQVGARLLVWFVGGTALGVGMLLTLIVFLTAVNGQIGVPSRWASWWVPGVAFIGIELVAQTALQVRGRPSFFNGMG